MKAFRSIPQLLFACACVVAFSACGNETPEDDRRVIDHADEVEPGTPLFGVYNAMKAMGTPVEMGGPVERPIFKTDGRKMTVNGSEIEVYEFDSKGDADKAASTVSSEGVIKGHTLKPPVHFYRTDVVIIVYAGRDQVVMDGISTAAGKPFATTFNEAVQGPTSQ